MSEHRHIKKEAGQPASGTQVWGGDPSSHFLLPAGSFPACWSLKKIGISIFGPQTDVLDKENVSKNTKAVCHSGFLTDRGKR